MTRVPALPALSLAATVLFVSPPSSPAAEDCAGTQSPRIEWTEACTRPREGVVCVRASQSPLRHFEEYTTIQVGSSAPPSRRYQMLPWKDAADAGTRWRVLVEAPADEVCVPQRANARDPRRPCGAPAAEIPVEECDREGVAMDSCHLRPTPYDNPCFPGFPNPESVAQPYFGPWPALDRAGGLPGELDDVFFRGLHGFETAGGGLAPGPDALSPARRRQLELLAWQEFVAIHWPVSGAVRSNLDDAAEDESLCPVWAGWRRKDEVLRGGELPLPWGLFPVSHGQGRACSASAPGGPPLASISATGGLPGLEWRPGEAAAQATGRGHFLFDARNLFVFYDTRVGRGLYDEILARGLYHPATGGLNGAFLGHGTFYRPYGAGTLRSASEDEGPIAVKFAWKPLTTCDRETDFVVARTRFAKVDREEVLNDLQRLRCEAGDAPPTTPGGTPARVLARASTSRPVRRQVEFLASIGLVKDGVGVVGQGRSSNTAPVEAAASSSANCPLVCEGENCLFGLVAMHIAHKTKTNPDWNWATFAHRDALHPRPGREALFVAGPCDGKQANCNTCRAGRCATRICSNFEPAEQTRALNGAIAAMFEKAATPQLRRLSNYELLGVQWVAHGSPSPAGLLNPLMETFVTDRQVGDCFSCHRKAADGDFLFFLKAPRPHEPSRPSPGG